MAISWLSKSQYVDKKLCGIDDEVQRGDFGEFAEDDSASEPEEYEIFETESDPESDEFYVNCASCSYITDIVSGQPTWLLPLFNF